MEFLSFRWVPVIYLVELIGISCVFQFTKQGNLQSTMLSIFSRRNLIINGQGKREELELNDLTDSCLWQWNKVVPVQATKAYGGQDVQLHLLSLALEGCQLHAQAALPQRMSPLPIEYEAGWISELSVVLKNLSFPSTNRPSTCNPADNDGFSLLRQNIITTKTTQNCPTGQQRTWPGRRRKKETKTQHFIFLQYSDDGMSHLTGWGYHSLPIGPNSVNRKARNDPIPKRIKFNDFPWLISSKIF